MGFFFFIIIVGIVVFLLSKRQKNVQGEWAQAASRLGLNYSRGGMLNPHWIYGKKAGLRYDIKTFTRSSGGTANQKWTGYRVRFPRSADMRIRVTETARNRLTNRFQECEIDDEGIFCARPGIESDAPALIDNVERLQSVTARLMAAANEDAGPPILPNAGPPTPASAPDPDDTSTPEVAVEIDAEGEKPPAIPMAELVQESEKKAEVIELDSESSDPEDAMSEGETDGEPEVPMPPLPESDPGDESEIEASDEEPQTLESLSRDLFDSGRNRFEITQRFDKEYKESAMIGEGTLLRAETYSNDRVFGRGPGTLAEVEIDRPEEPLPGHNIIRAVIQLPETANARSLRSQVGDTFTVSGTLLRCDAFEGRIFLGSGEIA